MNNKGWRSQDNISENIKFYEISELQPEHANRGSSESDLVSGKMKEVVIVYYNSNTTTIIYNIFLTTSDTI